MRVSTSLFCSAFILDSLRISVTKISFVSSVRGVFARESLIKPKYIERKGKSGWLVAIFLLFLFLFFLFNAKRGKTRVTWLGLALKPHLIGWVVGTSFLGQSQNLCNHWLLFEPRSKGDLGGRFQTYFNPRSATSKIHTFNQLPTILFTKVFLESVQKPFSIITSDYIKFSAQNSSTKCTSPVY